MSINIKRHTPKENIDLENIKKKKITKKTITQIFFLFTLFVWKTDLQKIATPPRQGTVSSTSPVCILFRKERNRKSNSMSANKKGINTKKKKWWKHTHTKNKITSDVLRYALFKLVLYRSKTTHANPSRSIL